MCFLVQNPLHHAIGKHLPATNEDECTGNLKIDQPRSEPSVLGGSVSRNTQPSRARPLVDQRLIITVYSRFQVCLVPWLVIAVEFETKVQGGVDVLTVAGPYLIMWLLCFIHLGLQLRIPLGNPYNRGSQQSQS